MLVHARTDTKWFHNWVYGKAELRFVRGRLHFNGSKSSAPFPSMVVIYRPKAEEPAKEWTWKQLDIEDVLHG